MIGGFTMAAYNVIGVGQHKKFFDEGAYQDTINYILDSDKAAFTGSAGVSSPEAASEEMLNTAIVFGKNSGKRIRHSVLSFDKSENVSPELADSYAQGIIQYYAPEFQIVYAVHTNTDNTHIHFVMNQISHTDGHRYGGKKKDFYDFNKHMHNVTHLPILVPKNRPSET